MRLQGGNPDVVPTVKSRSESLGFARTLRSQNCTVNKCFGSALSDSDLARSSARPRYMPTRNTNLQSQGGHSRVERSQQSTNSPTEFCRRVAVDPSDGDGPGAATVTCCCDNTNDELNQERRHLDDPERGPDLWGSTLTLPAAETFHAGLQGPAFSFLEGLEDTDFDNDIELFCDCGPECSCVGCMIHQNRADSVDSVEEDARHVGDPNNSSAPTPSG